MTKSVHDGRALFRATHPSRLRPEDRELPTAETGIGRGRLLALVINAGVPAERREAARKALEDWQAQQSDARSEA